MYRCELVEGKYRPNELGRPGFETGPGTSKMSLMWSMNKPFWGTGNSLMMESVCCVCKWLIGMY